MRAIQGANSMEELAEIIDKNMQRFKDKNGKTLPIVKEFMTAARGTEKGKKIIVKKEPIKPPVKVVVKKPREDLKDLPTGSYEFEVKSKGRKWFKISFPGKDYVFNMEINDLTKDYKVGDNIFINAAKETVSNKYGSKTTFFPISAADKDEIRAEGKIKKEAYQKEKNRKEIDRYMGFIRNARDEGYFYKNGYEKIKALGAMEDPEIKKEIDSIIIAVTEIKKAEKIKQYMGYLKESAEKGYLNKNAVSKLKEFGVEDSKYAEEFKNIKISTQEKVKKEKKGKMLYPLYNSPQTGIPVKKGEKIIVYENSGQAFRINENHPSVFGSHLLGHEGEQGAYFYYRDANESEIKEYEEKEKKVKQKQEERAVYEKTMDSLTSFIQKNGEYPEGSNSIQGEEYLDTFNIYGGGKKILRDNGYIWFIKNNGMDGDDWSRNNVKTSGAGAIGWKIKETPELISKIESIKEFNDQNKT